MFIKGCVFGPRSLVGGKERKKLRAQIFTAFRRCSEADLDLLLPGGREELEIAKVQNSKATVYLGKGVPLFFDATGKGDFFPTVYALWQIPQMLESFVIHHQSSSFLMGGADLMLPGVLTPSGGFERLNLLANQRWSVRVKGSPFPFAVGRTLTSAVQVANNGMRGKCLQLLHVLGDGLWQCGPKTVPDDCFTATAILSPTITRPEPDFDAQDQIRESSATPAENGEGGAPAPAASCSLTLSAESQPAALETPAAVDVAAAAMTRKKRRARHKRPDAVEGKAKETDGWGSDDGDDAKSASSSSVASGWEEELEKEEATAAVQYAVDGGKTAAHVDAVQSAAETAVSPRAVAVAAKDSSMVNGGAVGGGDDGIRDGDDDDEDGSPLTKKSLAPPAVDFLLGMCLLEALHSHVTDSQLPLDASAVFARTLQTAPLVLRYDRVLLELEKEHAVDPRELFEMLEVMPASGIVDVQKSSHKKAGKFLVWATKSKWLDSKEQRGNRVVIKVNRSHPKYVSYVPVPAEVVKRVEKLQSKQKAAEGDPPLGGGGDEQRETVKGGSTDSTGKGPTVFELYRMLNKCRAILVALDDGPPPEKYLTMAEAIQVLNRYIAEVLPKNASEQEIQADGDDVKTSGKTSDKGMVLIDKTLGNALNLDEDEQISRAALAKAFAAKLDVSHSIVRAGANLKLDPPKIVKGHVKPLEVAETVRHGRNYVTTVQNQDLYYIDAKVLSELLAKKMASSSSIFDVPVPKHGQPRVGVAVQGKVGEAVVDVLTSEFGLNRKYVALTRTNK